MGFLPNPLIEPSLVIFQAQEPHPTIELCWVHRPYSQIPAEHQTAVAMGFTEKKLRLPVTKCHGIYTYSQTQCLKLPPSAQKQLEMPH